MRWASAPWKAARMPAARRKNARQGPYKERFRQSWLDAWKDTKPQLIQLCRVDRACTATRSKITWNCPEARTLSINLKKAFAAWGADTEDEVHIPEAPAPQGYLEEELSAWIEFLPISLKTKALP